MAGRHLSHAGDDDVEYPVGLPNGGDSAPGRRERLIDPGARISEGTSVTVDMEAMPTRPHAAPSDSNPDALVEGGKVGDGHELE
ncbi:hypothetical protein [Pseudolysinimonas sp.]|uniref:hypothetical protein n=1 Tax=Pseudolysinimonas sp. TaxID=2680009 RepID=UPI003F7F5D3C